MNKEPEFRQWDWSDINIVQGMHGDLMSFFSALLTFSSLGSVSVSYCSTLLSGEGNLQEGICDVVRNTRYLHCISSDQLTIYCHSCIKWTLWTSHGSWETVHSTFEL